jgi:hypothetical protein
MHNCNTVAHGPKIFYLSSKSFSVALLAKLIFFTQEKLEGQLSRDAILRNIDIAFRLKKTQKS